MKKLSAFLVSVVLAAAVVGCVAPPPLDDSRLKLALIPVLDTIPIFIAQQNRYFAEQGIQVESVPVKSPRSAMCWCRPVRWTAC